MSTTRNAELIRHSDLSGYRLMMRTLDELVNAALTLVQLAEASPTIDLAKGYPHYLPSFDEVLDDLMVWRDEQAKTGLR